MPEVDSLRVEHADAQLGHRVVAERRDDAAAHPETRRRDREVGDSARTEPEGIGPGLLAELRRGRETGVHDVGEELADGEQADRVAGVSHSSSVRRWPSSTDEVLEFGRRILTAADHVCARCFRTVFDFE